MKNKKTKNMFNTAALPKIDFGLAEISYEAQKLTGKLSISGVQPKLPVKLDKEKNILITAAKGSEYILKPQTQQYPDIPQNEQCCMDIVQKFEIDVPPHCLLVLKDKSFAYIVKRFDRKGKRKIHQEEFFQILGSHNKYLGSVEQIGHKLKEISSVPGLDVQLFFERVVLNFLLGNGDAHLKNFSMIYGDNGQRRLSPAYDIVCSKLVILNEEDSALSLNGKRNKISRKDFDLLADHFNIPLKVRYEKFRKTQDAAREIIRSSKLPKESQSRFIKIIEDRYSRMGLS